MTSLAEIKTLLARRNARETYCFASLVNSNAALRLRLQQTPAAPRFLSVQQHDEDDDDSRSSPSLSLRSSEARRLSDASVLHPSTPSFSSSFQSTAFAAADAAASSSSSSASSSSSTAALSALSSKCDSLTQKLAASDMCSRRLAVEVSTLRKKGDDCHVKIAALTTELEVALGRAGDAENEGKMLLQAIAVLKSENDNLAATLLEVRKERDESRRMEDVLVNRVVSEKTAMAEKLNSMNDDVERLQNENAQLRQLLTDAGLDPEEPRRRPSSSGGDSLGDRSSADVLSSQSPLSAATASRHKAPTLSAAIVPSGAAHVLKPHGAEVNSLAFDPYHPNLVASCSSDSTVKITEISSSGVRTVFTLRPTALSPLVSVDLLDGMCCAAGVDKSCWVWNVKSEKVLNQLIGHGNKLSSCRFVGGSRNVLTASHDSCLKLWDVSKGAYSLSLTMRAQSAANGIDVSNTSALSCHQDGGVRFWDLRSGSKTAELPSVSSSGPLSAARFSPAEASLSLVTGRDGNVRLLDMRQGGVIATLAHSEYRAGGGGAPATFSPDGAYVLAGGDRGDLFVWRVDDGKLIKKLPGHKAATGAVAWGRGDFQVASADRNGNVIIWT